MSPDPSFAATMGLILATIANLPHCVAITAEIEASPPAHDHRQRPLRVRCSFEI